VIRRFGCVAALLLTLTTGLSAQDTTEELARRLARINRELESMRRVVVALRSSEIDFLMQPIDATRHEDMREPRTMQAVARLFNIEYNKAWERNPVALYVEVIKLMEETARQVAAQLEARRNAERVDLSPPRTGPPAGMAVARDWKGRPVVTNELITRYIRALFARTQSGAAPWSGGNFTKFDYEDVDKRIEWARSVKRSQGGESLAMTPAVREHFGDDEVHVLNARWKDLDNAQNGRWDLVNW
jgi:hypothetical protein